MVLSPLYDGHIIYSDDLAAIKMKKKKLVLNKPIYAGMCILDLSKLHMYKFHYDVDGAIAVEDEQLCRSRDVTASDATRPGAGCTH